MAKISLAPTIDDRLKGKHAPLGPINSLVDMSNPSQSSIEEYLKVFDSFIPIKELARNFDLDRRVRTFVSEVKGICQH